MWVQKLLRAMALAAGAVLGWWVVGPPTVRAEVAGLTISTEPLALVRREPGVDRVGPLIWLGGIVLRSPDRRFGGLSDLHWEAECGRLLAITDTGAWVILVPQEDRGRLTGISDAWIAPLRDPQGRPAERKSEADSEALVREASGHTHIWFERRNAVQRYSGVSACRPDSLDRPADSVIEPPSMKDWPVNGGPEAAAPLGDGQIVLAEDVVDSTSAGVGVILAPDGTERARIAVPWPAGFLPTAMQRLAEGNGTSRYLVLLRMFSPMRGIAARLMIIDVPHEGGRLTPRNLAELRAPVAVDNMEGLAIREEGGVTMIYLVSDNNFNSLQRNLLMKFALPEGLASAPARP